MQTAPESKAAKEEGKGRNIDFQIALVLHFLDQPVIWGAGESDAGNLKWHPSASRGRQGG